MNQRARALLRAVARNGHLLLLSLTLIALGLTTSDTFEAVIWLIALLPVINWVVAIVLVIAAWPPPRATALIERAAVAVDVGISSTLAALLALNRQLDWDWPSEVVFPLLLLALVLVSAPAFYWFHLYLHGRFGAEE